MSHFTLLVCLLLVPLTLSAKLPSSFKKCDRKRSDFGQCLTEAIDDAIHQLDKPFKGVGLPRMEPLEVPKLVIGAGSGAVAFQQNYNNVKVSGFTKTNCSKAEVNFEEKTLTMECWTPQVIMSFNYEVRGKILLLPIYGKGPGNITLSRVRFSLRFDLNEFEKKGEKHFKVVGTKLDLNPGELKFSLEGLFEGDKALGDSILQVMNDNWKEVFADVKPNYEEAYARIFASIGGHLFSKISVKDLFGEE